ncbi:hypothetical protein C5U48_06260 [Mycolicibacter virginiensis]|uniref:Pilin n=1 Tax=Mycolicibacter virginiensis TaxID=1795032 RepID=A0A9X7IPJ0_9MYCO|nr:MULTISPECIES: hypothetical protein [Mycobacteriaceae]PQM53010.1 hypothetical protein C5U48_06260 [Mycolicibacter virginiensis]
MESLSRIFAATFAIAAGTGLTGLGVAAQVQALPAPMPAYHWCPGQIWDSAWGMNWEKNECHDDHHRDRDGNDHSRDFRGDQRGPGGINQHGPQGPHPQPPHGPQGPGGPQHPGGYDHPGSPGQPGTGPR